MDKNALETQIASQICQEPALLQKMTVNLDDFSNWEAVHCIQAVERMEKDGVRVNRSELARYVETMDRAAVSKLWNAAPTRANFQHHMRALQTIVKTSKLANLSSIIDESLSKREGPDATIARIEEYLHMIQAAGTTYEPETIGQALKGSIERLQERMKNPGLPGITTGYHELNRLFGGFEANKLYYVGARPSQGKTALMLNFLLHALSANASVGVISVESTGRELADRILSIKGTVDSMALRRGDFGSKTASVANNLTEVVNALYERPGLIYHNPHSSIADVALQIRRMVRNSQIKIAFVDYVQLIAPGKKFGARHEEVAHVSRELKAIASDNGIAVVALAQMRRAVDGKKSEMGDFAESSSLEKDADVMMAIQHEARDEGEYSAIKVLKARDGITGECPVRFTREYLKFTEVI